MGVYGLFFGPFHGGVDGETNDEAEESVEHAEDRGAALLLHLGRTCNITLCNLITNTLRPPSILPKLQIVFQTILIFNEPPFPLIFYWLQKMNALYRWQGTLFNSRWLPLSSYTTHTGYVTVSD